MGKKWSWISKQLKGRNENAVKNRYTSIIRSLKKNDKLIDLNDINIVIESFKQRDIEAGLPVKKVELNFNKLKNSQQNLSPEYQYQRKNSINEVIETSSSDYPLIDKNYENSLVLNDNHFEKSFPLIPESYEPKTLIYDVSNYALPNIYDKNYQQEDFFDYSVKKIVKKNFLDYFIQDEFDDISQKISSMSLSDQLLIEASKILSGISCHTLNSHTSKEKDFIHNSLSNFSNEKSFNLLNEREDKKQMLIPSIDHPNFYDDNCGLCASSQNRLLKLRTKTINIKSPKPNCENKELKTNGSPFNFHQRKKSGTMFIEKFLFEKKLSYEKNLSLMSKK